MNRLVNKIIATLIIFSIVACQRQNERETENLQNNCKTYFIENFKDSTSTLDAFKLVKFDNINERMLLFEQSSVLNNQLKTLINLYKQNTKLATNGADQIRLYGILGSSDLVAIEKRELLLRIEKGKAIKSEIDTLMAVIEKIADKSLIADTLKPLGFQAVCYYQIKRKDKSVKQDTTFILLNINKDIINRNDFLKLPYTVNLDKFD